jgi:toxin-antitoxin system PIN domain toxin
MRALLDVNVLIALLDAAHVHHRQAVQWLESEAGNGWASCPLTQNGCIRVMAQPGYPGTFRAPEVAERLREATGHPSHEFWPVDRSRPDAGTLDWSHVLGHSQITDAYLLSLAVQRGGRFVTFDRNVARAAVPGAEERHLVMLAS